MARKHEIEFVVEQLEGLIHTIKRRAVGGRWRVRLFNTRMQETSSYILECSDLELAQEIARAHHEKIKSFWYEVSCASD